VHHGLRGREADRDLAFVRDQARRRGLPVLGRRVDPAALAAELGLSPEAAARHLRYEALLEMAREAGAARIAVAHHRDDVAETHVLARRRRGGLFALAGPRAERVDGVVRPLLGVTRREIRSFLEARGVGFRRDASNGDLRFSRNRIRRELAARGAPAGAELAREAEELSAERARVEDEVARRLRPRLLEGPDDVLVDASFFASCPPEVARRGLFVAASGLARRGRPPFTGPERERILELLAGGDDFRFEAGRRLRFERRGRLLRIATRPDVSKRAAKG
jgi:tRNA(Ile)-lysidine synthase